MKQATKSLGVFAIIAILALVTISGSIDNADAVKAKKSTTTKHSFGAKNANIVCGDKLCSSGENPDPINVGTKRIRS